MGSTVIYEDQDTFDDGTRYEMIATAIPKSDDYPEGVKYRFQYMAEDGRTLLRFDNYPNHPGVDRHHYHPPPVSMTTLSTPASKPTSGGSTTR
ncbi:toxin-antitoxin system TumE family protein [Halorubrum salsamenti]|uniref:toxin-antitoxin system TumE family protein n=1 Tax=Halorubrum salsamenti TaxID=2583990 RepID=UPI0019D50A0C|nr:DUF6516 family protein [Halorubrum salsamenti]